MIVVQFANYRKVNGIPPVLDKIKIAQATELLLEGLGVDLSDHNFADTPDRVARAYAEIFSPPELDIPVFAEDYTDMVLMRGHEFYTLCPHHLLPVRIVASLAYIPNGSVIGASKLVRMIHDVNRKPMTQEALTKAVTCRIRQLTKGDSQGEAVMMRGEHGCFRIRGVRSSADMVTWKFAGLFQTDRDLQTQFMRLVGGR